MKRKIILIFCIATLGIATGFAKDFRVAVFKVEQMMCENCEKKVQTNIRFEKGLKELTTDLKEKTVTITYDPAKTDAQKLQAGFRKFKYEAMVLEDKVKEPQK